MDTISISTLATLAGKWQAEADAHVTIPSTYGTARRETLRECADVLRWLDAHCAFPCSMVDRIVPAATPEVMTAAQEALGVQDQCALSTEGFWEWVIEDRFADPTDAALLQSAGVRVTGDVHSYEEAKLRMLNGSHSAMALIGAITGRPYIASCIGVDHIRNFVHRLMSREVAPHLSRSDWADYRDALIARFGNPYLKHSVHQIATDSSQKIPQRWPPSVLGQIAQGASFEHHALAAAVFVRYTLGVDEQGQAYALNDPQADSLMAELSESAEDSTHRPPTPQAGEEESRPDVHTIPHEQPPPLSNENTPTSDSAD